MKLHLGVVDIPYVKRGGSAGASTGDVAGWLENKYGIMQFFYNKYGSQIGDAMAKGFVDALETSVMRGRTPTDPFAGAMSKTQAMFQQLITMQEMNGASTPSGLPIPTRAARLGISSRFKRRRSGSARPSFRDTGLYLQSFRSWIEP